VSARATLPSPHAQTLLRNLSSHASSTGRAFRLLDLASSAVELAVSPHVHLHLSWAIFLYVSRPMRQRPVAEWDSPSRSHSSPRDSRRRLSQDQDHPFPAVEGQSRTVHQLVDSFRKLLVFPAEPSVRGDLVVTRGARSTGPLRGTSPGTDSGTPVPRSGRRKWWGVRLSLGAVQWTSWNQCPSGRIRERSPGCHRLWDGRAPAISPAIDPWLSDSKGVHASDPCDLAGTADR